MSLSIAPTSLKSCVMDNVFIAVTIALAGFAVATFIGIARDAWPHLPDEHRYALKHFFENSTWQQRRACDRAMKQAWQIHVETFPYSRKRLLFGVLLTATMLSPVTYPLWMAFSGR